MLYTEKDAENALRAVFKFNGIEINGMLVKGAWDKKDGLIEFLAFEDNELPQEITYIPDSSKYYDAAEKAWIMHELSMLSKMIRRYKKLISNPIPNERRILYENEVKKAEFRILNLIAGFN